MTDGKARVRADVMGAKKVKRQKADGSHAKAPAYLLKAFEMKLQGLFYHKGEDKPPLWVCAPFQVIAFVRDAAQTGWGLLLRFNDADGVEHEVIVPRTMLTGEGAELRAMLASLGFLMNTRQDARQALVDYLAAYDTEDRAHVATQCGWVKVCGALAFVLPSGSIGKTAERVVLQNIHNDPSSFQESGTLREWQESVSSTAIGNSRLILVISTGFTGPLLYLLGEDGGGVHLQGRAKSCKTLALTVAASIWGGTAGLGAKGMVASWLATANAMGAVAQAHSDTLLVIDEINQVDGKEVGDVIYMIGNGRTKARSDRSGALRTPSQFRLIYLSSGEISLADKMAESGKAQRAGQEVRCIIVAAEAGANLSILNKLPDGAESVEAFAAQTYAATRTQYGTAGPAFLRYLIDSVQRDPELPARLAADIETLASTWLAGLGEASAQVRTVSRRFALFAVAGELASRAAVTGWGPGIATEGVRVCFEGWLADREGVESREDMQAIQKLRDFCLKYGSSRFDDWPERPAVNEAAQFDPDKKPANSRFPSPNRAGWKKWDAKAKRFILYLTSDALRNDVLLGLDFNSSVKLLAARGYLVKDKAGKSSVSVSLYGIGQTRLYQVSNRDDEKPGDDATAPDDAPDAALDDAPHDGAGWA